MAAVAQVKGEEENVVSPFTIRIQLGAKYEWPFLGWEGSLFHFKYVSVRRAWNVRRRCTRSGITSFLRFRYLRMYFANE